MKTKAKNKKESASGKIPAAAKTSISTKSNADVKSTSAKSSVQASHVGKKKNQASKPARKAPVAKKKVAVEKSTSTDKKTTMAKKGRMLTGKAISSGKISAATGQISKAPPAKKMAAEKSSVDTGMISKGKTKKQSAGETGIHPNKKLAGSVSTPSVVGVAAKQMSTSKKMPAGPKPQAISKSALKAYKELLLKKKNELLEANSAKKMPIETTESSRKGDWIDQSSEDNDIYINMHLRQTDARVLKAIEGALIRIEHRTFGICESCDEPISSARLNAVPWAKVCVACKEKKD